MIRRYQNVKSSDLDSRLKQVLEKREKIEKDYRETKQKFWCIMFVDVSNTAQAVWDLGEQMADVIFSMYQKQVRSVLKKTGACFIEPGGGPQVVSCFVKPADAILAAKTILVTLHEWNRYQKRNLKLVPSIGIHQGYINYHDALIHQSNTNNMAKRIQSEAEPSQILLSEDIYKKLKNDKRFSLSFLKTADLKNIPEPQNLYEAKVLVSTKPVEVDENIDINQVEEHVPETEETALKETHHWNIVFIDVCESTKKFWSYGDREASRLISEYQKLCHITFTNCGATFIKSCEGDQIFAGFDSEDTKLAVISSIQIMQYLFRRNVNVPQNRQVHAAIGLHIGEVAIEGEDLVQTKDMRVGKEIQSQAVADEILVSEDIVNHLDQSYQAFLEEYGEREFSGVSKTYPLSRLKWYRVPPKLAAPPPNVRQTKRYGKKDQKYY